MRIELLWKKSGRQVQIDVPREGKTLLTILREQGIYVDAPCGGNGTCGRCLVQFLEPEMGERLACEIVPEWDCKVVLPDVTEDMAAVVGCNAVDKREVETDAEPAGGHSYGIAVDIGTTTLAASLLDLNSKRECAVAAAVNHQRAYGADVISRIQCANEGQGEILRNCIRKDLTDLTENLTAQAGIRKEQVERIVIAANTTMCHLLRGLPCEGLGAAPYTPEDISLWEGTWDEWQAEVTILPGISAFVGGDIVAGLFACGMDERTEPGFFLDIGTNGEMAVGNKDGFLVTSAAAGPVFEGGNISCGVPGIPGAVTHLTAASQQNDWATTQRNTSTTAQQNASMPGHVIFETIGGEPPIGLCGTGIIDAVSLLMEKKLIDENGTMEEPWFTDGAAIAGDAIRFTQADVREVQMGKSAVRSGIETLLGEYRRQGRIGRSEVPSVNEQAAEAVAESGAEPSRGMDVFLAGGFGYDMNASNAIRIGLFPAEFEGNVHPVGNSALEGAKKFLLSEEGTAKKRIERIVKNAEEISLAMHPKFNELYLQYMFFE